MPYIVVRQPPMYHQMTLEELWFSPNSGGHTMLTANTTNTRTYVVESVGARFLSGVSPRRLLHRLADFNRSVEPLRGVPRQSLYHTFFIPKKSGGLRRIDAPNDELKEALRALKTLFESDFRLLAHTSAFAYVKGRCPVDAVRRHQQNQSRWYAKLDLRDFFGSTTLDFTMAMFSQVFPFSEVVALPGGAQELRSALELAFLNGGLPQGTPLSPLITNTIMIPVDYRLFNSLREFDGQKFVYTRYADDFLISSRTHFDVRRVQSLVEETLSSFGAPFSLNAAKTRYGSSAGSNWNLGVMLNKDNQITIGHKKKRQFQSMLYNYITARRSGSPWSLGEIQYLHGLYSYYHSVEPGPLEAIVSHIDEKMGSHALAMLAEDLHGPLSA